MGSQFSKDVNDCCNSRNGDETLSIKQIRACFQANQQQRELSPSPLSVPVADTAGETGQPLQADKNPPTRLVGGLGCVIQFDQKSDQLSVREVLQGGPAEKQGIRSGDVIIGIDGFDPWSTLPGGLAVGKPSPLTGPGGSACVLELKRGPLEYYLVLKRSSWSYPQERFILAAAPTKAFSHVLRTTATCSPPPHADVAESYAEEIQVSQRFKLWLDGTQGCNAEVAENHAAVVAWQKEEERIKSHKSAQVSPPSSSAAHTHATSCSARTSERPLPPAAEPQRSHADKLAAENNKKRDPLSPITNQLLAAGCHIDLQVLALLLLVQKYRHCFFLL